MSVMIIIIRALSRVRKKEKGQKKRRPKKRREMPNKKREGPKKRIEKERRDNATILFPHFCFKVAPCLHDRESLILSLSYTSGNFRYRTWLIQ